MNMGFDVNNTSGLTKFFNYIDQNIEKGNLYFKESEGEIIPISFAEFDQMDEKKKESVYQRLQEVITKLEGMPIPSMEKPLSKIIQIRNAIFYDLNKSAHMKVNAIPAEIQKKILSSTFSNDMDAAVKISKEWQKTGAEVRIDQINQGIPLKNVVPQTIKTGKDAIEWLRTNIPEEKHSQLKYADLSGFHDIDDDDAAKFLEFFPNVSDLKIKSDGLSELPDFPHSLLTLDCSGCTNLTHLPYFPSSLQALDCSECISLDEESLARLDEFNKNSNK